MGIEAITVLYYTASAGFAVLTILGIWFLIHDIMSSGWIGSSKKIELERMEEESALRNRKQEILDMIHNFAVLRNIYVSPAVDDLKRRVIEITHIDHLLLERIHVRNVLENIYLEYFRGQISVDDQNESSQWTSYREASTSYTSTTSMWEAFQLHDFCAGPISGKTETKTTINPTKILINQIKEICKKKKGQ